MLLRGVGARRSSKRHCLKPKVACALPVRCMCTWRRIHLRSLPGYTISGYSEEQGHEFPQADTSSQEHSENVLAGG
jgi:hypothetical protein